MDEPRKPLQRKAFRGSSMRVVENMAENPETAAAQGFPGFLQD